MKSGTHREPDQPSKVHLRFAFKVHSEKDPRCTRMSHPYRKKSSFRPPARVCPRPLPCPRTSLPHRKNQAAVPLFGLFLPLTCPCPCPCF